MKIKRIVRPGQPGTKKLVERYGDNLICVRYRYDTEKKRMFKTIELVIENQPWPRNFVDLGRCGMAEQVGVQMLADAQLEHCCTQDILNRALGKSFLAFR